MQVKIEYCQSPLITVPNIFTPNGDEVNDAWALQIQNELSIQNYQCTLYNRWGTQVFETTSPAAYWDGHTTSGLDCQAGTYFYIINYTDAKTNQNKILKGFLELVR
jgi:gliding motility-associated-like protein